MNISHRALHRVVVTVLTATDSDEAEATIVADHLVDANLAGHDSHGVGMLPIYVRRVREGQLRPNTPARLLRDDGWCLSFDGGRGFGQRVAREVFELALDRCAERGFVLATLRGAHHVGRLGDYGERCAAAGKVAICLANVIDHEPFVAPHRGTDGRLSTNPICFAFPGTASTPDLVLDFATTKIALGKARVALDRGEALPKGAALDALGYPTTDPSALFLPPTGVLLPFAQHKGFALALLVEVLAGTLTGGGTIQPGNTRHGSTINNVLALLIDPERLADLEWMHAEIDAVVTYIKASPPQDPRLPVVVPGEPEREARRLRMQDGVPVDTSTWNEILRAGELVGVPRAALTGIAECGDGR